MLKITHCSSPVQFLGTQVQENFGDQQVSLRDSFQQQKLTFRPSTGTVHIHVMNRIKIMMRIGDE